MSIYSCYLVTHAAMEQFNLSNIPDEWFNWRFVHTPLGHDESVTLKRIEIVDSSQSDRVQEWYTQVTAAGLASTLIRTTYEGNEAFPLTATDPWGGGADLFLGMMIPGDKDEIAGWISHLSQPDELAVLGWVGHRLGGGGDRSRYFNRVPNFAHCYANELKRWIACPGNAELLAEQWDDVRGWPEDTPSLTVDDFAWDRESWDDERTKLWVPMLRLPFCEIGFDKLASCSSTNGLLPDDRKEGRWLFDPEGKVEAELKRRAHAESMMRNAAPVAAGRDEAAGGVPLRDWCPRPNAQPAFLQASMASRVNRIHVALMGAEPDVDAGFTIDLGTYFRDATLFPDTAAEVDAGWDEAKLTIQWHLPARTSVAFKALRLPQGWDLQITLAPTDTPLLLTAGNGYWVEFPVANDTRLHELKGTISARRLPAPD